MQVNRFMWEDVEKGVLRKNKRIRSIIKFDHVIRVSSKNIQKNTKNKFLDFLAIETKEMPDKTQEMKLIFLATLLLKLLLRLLK